ncbi:MAG: ATP-binding protein [Candidatus Binataceae bacterium]
MTRTATHCGSFVRSSGLSHVSVGTRLTIVLLLALTPVALGYTYWSVRGSSRTYIDDLKREARAISRGMAPALVNDIQAQEWDQINDVFARLAAVKTLAAWIGADGKLRLAASGFPLSLVPGKLNLINADSGGLNQFEHDDTGRHWFCHLVPLHARDGQRIGYLLVAQDWSDISSNLRTRTFATVAAALLVAAITATIIPLMIRRYVSNPLAELSQRVMRFSSEDGDRGHERDEVRLLNEEFRRLDHQLSEAHTALIEKHQRELDLVHRLQHADRLATIGTLASGLAHEIGTPMGVIRARAEYLQRIQPDAAKTAEGLDIIIRQIDRISHIVRLLLDYARGHKALRTSNDVRTIIEHTLGLLEAEAARRGVKVTAALGDQPLIAECDPDQIQQVFINLAVNAFDAMTPGGGTLRVAAEIAHNHGTRVLKLAFEDSGCGVAAEHRAHIFDPFFTTKEPGKGTGMGLAVSQSIMYDHRGKITFDPGPSGTTFIVTMPMVSPATATESATRSSVETRS